MRGKKRSLTVAARIALCCGAALFAQEKDKPAPPAKGTISGTVTALGSNAPMKEVEVWADRNRPSAVHTITDVQGRFMLRDVTPGQPSVSVSAPIGGRIGFGPSGQRIVTLAPGQ